MRSLTVKHAPACRLADLDTRVAERHNLKVEQPKLMEELTCGQGVAGEDRGALTAAVAAPDPKHDFTS